MLYCGNSDAGIRRELLTASAASEISLYREKLGSTLYSGSIIKSVYTFDTMIFYRCDCVVNYGAE